MKDELHYHKLFAISGVRGSGKDTTASMLQYCLSVPKIFRQYWLYKLFRKLIIPKYKIIAFASPLKEMLSVLLNIPVKRFNDRDFKENYAINLSTLDVFKIDEHPNCYVLSDSKFNKLLKTETLENYNITIRQLMQYFGTNVSQKYFGRRIWINSVLKRANDNIIISDLRFIEEFNAVKDLNGTVFFINRPDYEFGQHASEKEMQSLLEDEKYDAIIRNNGTLKDLFNKVKHLLECNLC